MTRSYAPHQPPRLWHTEVGVLSVYESRLWKLGRSLLPQKIRLRVRIPIVKGIVLYNSTVHGSYSVNGEDLLLKSLIHRGADVWYMDIGAGDPRLHSNTYGFYRTGANGVAVDANRGLLAEFSKVRPRDTAIWGAITQEGGLGGSVIYWQLDPWELSTTDPGAMQHAVKNGARVVSESQVPTIDVNDILQATYPLDDRTALLNVDVEGISYEVLNAIDFTRFPFDYVLVERDSPEETFGCAGRTGPDSYVKIRSLGPTDAYSRAGVQ